MYLNRQELSSNGFECSKTQSCSCRRCQRMRKFEEVLDRLTFASKQINYEEEIFATVAMICNVYIQLY